METEAWARSGQSTTVGSSYILEPGQPVQTTLYDGKLYTITGHHEVDTVVKIAQVRPEEVKITLDCLLASGLKAQAAPQRV